MSARQTQLTSLGRLTIAPPFDHIIAGSGAADSAQAERSSADPPCTVLAVEANGPDRNPVHQGACQQAAPTVGVVGERGVGFLPERRGGRLINHPAAR